MIGGNILSFAITNLTIRNPPTVINSYSYTVETLINGNT